jgi:DNA-binding transcriptional ArsR family regulator
MPIGEKTIPSARADPTAEIRVAVSAPAELFWLLWRGASNYRPRPGTVPAREIDELRPNLFEEIGDFWNDGLSPPFEMALLANEAGSLLELSLDPFLSQLEETAAAGVEDPSLPAETAGVRQLTYSRLKRLQGSATFRREYRLWIQQAWDAYREIWDRNLQILLSEGERLTAQLSGASLSEVLLPGNIGRHEAAYSPLVENAMRAGKLVISPIFIGDEGLIAVPGIVLVGLGVHSSEVIPRLLEDARGTAARVKAVADPTRLAILAFLGTRERSVSGIADAFRLSQAAISEHLAILRDADLLTSRRQNRFTLYTAPRERIQRFFTEAGEDVRLLCETSS